MDGVAKRELTEVEMILGKGMLYDSSGLTELVNILSSLWNYNRSCLVS